MTPKQESARLLDAVGPAFSRLRRSVLLDVENPVSAKDLTRTLVLNIVEQSGDDDVTVGDVAERLGIDPSVASRMVSDCIGADYLVRAASQRDGRRTVLRLSPEGTATLERFRQHQRGAFEFVTRDWTERDRLEFARLLLKYVDAIDALRGRDA
jgi:DNA-binding MarR family transcriptional regulator